MSRGMSTLRLWKRSMNKVGNSFLSSMVREAEHCDSGSSVLHVRSSSHHLYHLLVSSDRFPSSYSLEHRDAFRPRLEDREGSDEHSQAGARACVRWKR